MIDLLEDFVAPAPGQRAQRAVDDALDRAVQRLTIGNFLGIKFVVDPTMPPGELRLRGADGQVLRVTGLAVPEKSP
jgi:hypothetical protein